MRVSYKESIGLAVQMEDTLVRSLNGRPHYFSMSLQIEPLEEDNDIDKNENMEVSKRFYIGSNLLEFAFEMEDDFMRYYNEYKRRLNLKKKVKRRDDDDDEEDEVKAPVEESSSDITTLRTIKNTAKPVEAVIYLIYYSG